MKNSVLVFCALLLFLTGSASSAGIPDGAQPVDVLKLQGAIFSASARYVERGIRQAETDGAICVIELDTPGGLIQSMREIVQVISASSVPVIVYVYPRGAMATSAGAYIVYAASVAAMAPGTHMGSAHPIGLGFNNRRWKEPSLPPGLGAPSPMPSRSTGGEKSMEVDVEAEKATNAMVALMRSLAEKNGRNGEWGEKAVRESSSITAGEAVKLKVVEIYADDLQDLLDKLRGKQIVLADRKKVILDPDLAKIRYIPMSRIEKFLLILNDPQIAVILMLLGTLGLYYELATPGAILPGVVGGICIILGLYTLGSLPINYTAFGLLILSTLLFIGDIFAPSHGALTIGGIIAFILGALFLIPAGIPYLSVSKSLVFTIAFVLGTIMIIIMRKVLKSQKSKPYLDEKSYAGERARAKTALNPEGMVVFGGELWKARSIDGSPIQAGSAVIVEERNGLMLIVRETEAAEKDRDEEPGEQAERVAPPDQGNLTP